ncbi:hypothetical protein PR202_gb01197 [Eleusine coracana subsp. coracana]|uniref:Methyltransferase n=1 Tax=Eleusine coracana subsp. coracana TaxID=191504 RepID=A0AAV5DVH0_ELECO|nr:hypothetical protein PR202_gb01197 [Eleusine coracana subsp. coracana]
MGRWWSPVAEPRSVQLLLLGVALVAAAFYAGTLFGSSASPALVLPPSGPRSPVSSRTQADAPLFTNKVSLTYWTKPVSVPDHGVDVCPLEYNEHIPCHDAAYIRSLKSLDRSRHEDLEIMSTIHILLRSKEDKTGLHDKGKLWWFPGGGTHFKHGASEYIERWNIAQRAMCWKLIAKHVQTAIWVKPEEESCRLKNVDMKLLNI